MNCSGQGVYVYIYMCVYVYMFMQTLSSKTTHCIQNFKSAIGMKDHLEAMTAQQICGLLQAKPEQFSS